MLKSLSKSLGFEIEKEEKPYHPQFVKEVLEVAKEIRQGKGIKFSMEKLNSLWE